MRRFFHSRILTQSPDGLLHMPVNNDYLVQLSALLDAENQKIASESTLEDSVIALVASQKAANADLQAQVTDLVVDPAVKAKVDDLFTTANAALDANVAKLQVALPQNTPAATARRR